MTAPFINTTPANTTQFDLPPIASAPQWVAQATPFSQLFSQAQAAAPPPPAAAPAPPAPSSPPPPPPTSVSKSTDDGGHTSSPPADSTAASPPSPSADSGDSSPNEVAASPTNSAPGQTSQSAAQPNGDTSPGVQPKVTPSSGKGSPPQKKAVAAHDGQENQKNSLIVATTTAQATQIQKVAKDNDAGKNAKDSANNQANKDDDGGAQNSAPAPTTTDLGAQAVAGAVAVLPATEPTTKSDSKTTTGASHTSVQSAANVVQQAAVSKLSNQPASHATSPNVESGASTSPTANTSATVEKAASNAKAADAFHVDTSQAGKSANTAAAAAQGDAPAEAAASVPLPAQTVTAVATASEAQVVSTITVDPTTTGTSATPSAIDNPPPSASGAPTGDTPPNSAAAPSPFAASLAQNAPSATPAGGGLSTVDRARFVQRVARAFQAAGDDGGQMRLRLSPPDLGSLQLQISVKQGALSATIQADNSTAQQVLLDSLPDLRARLAQQDIRIEQFDVQLAGQGSGGMPQPQGNSDFNQPPPRPTSSTNSTVSSTTNENSPAVTSSPHSATGALNVIV